MQSIIDLIDAHSNRYPEFKEYIPLAQDAMKYVISQPDRSIEICKALFEGMSRTFILRLELNSDREAFKNMPFSEQVERAISALQRIEIVKPSPLSSIEEFIEMLRVTRNNRGDVSHGRPAPKLDKSNQLLAEYILQTSEAILRHMLHVFYERPGIISEDATDSDIDYEENQEFNNYLDDKYPLEGSKLNYSKALHETKYEDYINQLEDWKDRMSGGDDLPSSASESIAE